MLRLVRGDTERALLEAIDCLMAESHILKKRYEQDCGRRLLLSDQQRWELATRARPLVTSGYGHLIGISKPDTLMRWYRRPVARKAAQEVASFKGYRPACRLAPRVQRGTALGIARSATIASLLPGLIGSWLTMRQERAGVRKVRGTRLCKG